MQWLAALCVKRPVFATVLILSLTVIGIFSFTRLGVDRFPKVDFPTVLITTVQPGAAQPTGQWRAFEAVQAARRQAQACPPGAPSTVSPG